MSRIAKRHIPIPSTTQVTVADGVIAVKGPHGTVQKSFPRSMNIVVEAAGVLVTPNEDTKLAKALWGTFASHIKNMIAGVSTPFQKKLTLEGVGYRVEKKGNELSMALGFSHPVVLSIPEGLTVTAEKNNVTITGINKELVGQFAADVRGQKKPEPYKGKGFHYDTEIIRRKQGKKTVG